MQLEGSCHCQKVSFRVNAPHPYPFNQCYCSICRKTGGGGGYAINIGGEAASLEVSGRRHVAVYHARIDGADSPAERHFCRLCGSAFVGFGIRAGRTWCIRLHPPSTAICLKPPERVYMMLGSKASWAEASSGPHDKTFDEYPDEGPWPNGTGAWGLRAERRWVLRVKISPQYPFRIINRQDSGRLEEPAMSSTFVKRHDPFFRSWQRYGRRHFLRILDVRHESAWSPATLNRASRPCRRSMSPCSIHGSSPSFSELVLAAFFSRSLPSRIGADPSRPISQLAVCSTSSAASS